MKVELYYFDGCPSWQQALDNLKDALRLEQVSDEIGMVSVVDGADAQTKRFTGSPTIRIDGVDVEGPDAEARGYAYGCRVYNDGDRVVGWPSVGLPRQALTRDTL